MFGSLCGFAIQEYIRPTQIKFITLLICAESAKKSNMKQDGTLQKKQRQGKKVQIFKSRKKKSTEEDAAIQYLRAQYDKVSKTTFATLFPISVLYAVIYNIFRSFLMKLSRLKISRYHKRH